MQNFSIAIIGAGPGGYIAAIHAAQKGEKVALIEENFVGGVCLNVGCIPTKILLSHSEKLQQIQESKKFNIHVENISFDYPSTIEKKNQIISMLRKNVENLLHINGIELIRGKARFLDPYTLQVNKQTIHASKIIIATGSSISSLPNIDFNPAIMSSTSLLNLDQLPKSLTIIGGGYIGCEFASIFSSFGTKITILEAKESLLAGHSSAISKELSKIFTKQNIKVFTNTQIKKIEKTSNQTIIHTDKNEKIESEKILVAIGRYCHFEDLFLPSEIKIENGYIVTNEFMQSSINHIYAIGDITGKSLLAHVASHQAIIAVDHILGKNIKINYEAIPSVIYTHPPIASVGYTEEKAKEKGMEVICATYPYRALGKAIAASEIVGYAQIIADKKNHRILGAHIIGETASDLIAEMTLAITNQLTLEEICKTIHSHPTYSEIWLEAAFLALDRPLHFPPKKKSL